MKLSRTQVAWLVNSFREKDSGPSLWRTFWSARNAWLIAIPIAALGIWNFFVGEQIMACVLISVAWGNIFASIAVSIRSVVLWPVFREVTKWERVEELIREHDGAASRK